MHIVGVDDDAVARKVLYERQHVGIPAEDRVKFREAALEKLHIPIVLESEDVRTLLG